MRALSRIILGLILLFTLFWLRGQFLKLHHSLVELDKLSQNGGLLSGHTKNQSTNASSSAVDDPFRAAMHAIADALVSDNIEDFATAKSALRDIRDKTVVVARTTKENTDWVPLMLPKWVP